MPFYITSKEEYANALAVAVAVADKLTNDYDDSYAILLDVLWPPIERYESTMVQLHGG